MSSRPSERREAPYLFHGTSRPITGHHLLPALPSGDVGDPKFPVVFASDCLDFATLFAAKSRAVTHISAGSLPFLIVHDGHAEANESQGAVYVLENRGFKPATHEGKRIGKWWIETAVPISPEAAITIGGRQHLKRLGVVIVHVEARANPQWASEIDSALRSPPSPGHWWGALERMVATGPVRYERHEPPTDVRLPSAWQQIKGAFWDDVLAPKFPLRTRVRTIHGVDHACRTARLCRILHNVLVEQGAIRPFGAEELAALMVTAFLHDSERLHDSGPDTSPDRSAAFAWTTAFTVPIEIRVA